MEEGVSWEYFVETPCGIPPEVKTLTQPTIESLQQQLMQSTLNSLGFYCTTTGTGGCYSRSFLNVCTKYLLKAQRVSAFVAFTHLVREG